MIMISAPMRNGSRFVLAEEQAHNKRGKGSPIKGKMKECIKGNGEWIIHTCQFIYMLIFRTNVQN
jgi:hypothetical protein